MKKILPIGKKVLLGCAISLECFIGFICFYIVFALFGMMFSCGCHDNVKEITIFVRSNGVHTDICMPSVSPEKNWFSTINLADFKEKKKTEYIAIGWGDKGFFLDTPTWAELKASTAINAIFLPSPTALHVELLEKPKQGETIKMVQISRKSYKKLVAHIESTFVHSKKGVMLIPNRGYWQTDNFYEAHGNYHCFNTCNVWTNGALKSANIPTAIFSVFPEGNLMHLGH